MAGRSDVVRSGFRLVAFCLLAFCLPSWRLFATRSAKDTEKLKEMVAFTDSCGRKVMIPQNVTRVASSGAVSTMFMICVAPEYMCNRNVSFTAEELAYFPESVASLPVTGQLYGTRAVFNAEKVLSTGAEIMIDMGDFKEGIAESLDAVQEQLGIPCIFIQSDLRHMSQAFKTLGEVLYGKEARCAELAGFVDRTLAMADRNSKKTGKSISVMYSLFRDGLAAYPKGSPQAQVIELVGARNAVDVQNANMTGSGSLISLEQIYNFNPDVIILSDKSACDMMKSDEAWSVLPAVKNDRVYIIPDKPYSWMGNPASLNMLIGVWWLGNLLYPQYYDYDINEVEKEFCKLFWKKS